MSSAETDNPILRAAYGKSVFEVAAENPIPDNAWEFHIRKGDHIGTFCPAGEQAQHTCRCRNLNDAAYNSLKYVPVCCCTPVCAKCTNPSE
eukprot:1136313-Pelagomonas_calceolata.AAC.12